MPKQRPYAISIAGFDPSAGAGILADIKTFEQNGAYGFGVVSAITYQNDMEFDAVEWMQQHQIQKQIEVLIKRFEIRYIKIGLIENMETLQRIVSYLHQHIQNPIIVFDPILKASAGFVFHKTLGIDAQEYFRGLYCITPNLPEAIALFGNENLEQKLNALSNKVNIYLKGGHANGEKVTDTLFTKGKEFMFSDLRLKNGAKHGSGCVLSSVLTAQLALGEDIEIAAKNAFDYTYKFLSSNETLLGYHNNIKQYEVH